MALKRCALRASPPGGRVLVGGLPSPLPLCGPPSQGAGFRGGFGFCVSCVVVALAAPQYAFLGGRCAACGTLLAPGAVWWGVVAPFARGRETRRGRETMDGGNSTLQGRIRYPSRFSDVDMKSIFTHKIAVHVETGLDWFHMVCRIRGREHKPDCGKLEAKERQKRVSGGKPGGQAAVNPEREIVCCRLQVCGVGGRRGSPPGRVCSQRPGGAVPSLFVGCSSFGVPLRVSCSTKTSPHNTTTSPHRSCGVADARSHGTCFQIQRTIPHGARVRPGDGPSVPALP